MECVKAFGKIGVPSLQEGSMSRRTVLAWVVVATVTVAANAYLAVWLQWWLPQEDPLELASILATAPLAGLIVSCVHGLWPRHVWWAAGGVILTTAVLLRVWAWLLVISWFGLICLVAAGIGYLAGMGTWIRPLPSRRTWVPMLLAAAAATYVSVNAFTFVEEVRTRTYPWSVVRSATRRERDRLLRVSREMGIDPQTKLTEAQCKMLEERMGPRITVEVPLIGHHVRIGYPGGKQLSLTISWDDGRFGPIDFDTLAPVWASD
jgi:hypothetical protein